MTQRIRELAINAGYGSTRWNTTEDFENFMQKFAESLIRECADIATVNQYQAYTPGYYVLKHFGVEE